MSKMKLLFFAVPLAALLGCVSSASSAGNDRVDGKQARQLVEEGARLVDVRTPTEYEAKHLPSAINLPVQQLAERIKELEPKDKAIVLYCRSGNRSGTAQSMLKKSGFTKVYDLGPMTAW
jgi:phage shock protein E